jgi:2-dehydropantoate 2-reductase
LKIAIVGCGAVGSFYGARLSRAGHELHFLLRSDYEVVRREGVRIESVDGDFTAKPRCASDPEQIGPCEVVLIALKTTANREAFPRLLPPLVEAHTRVISLQNGLGDEEELAELLGAEKVLGGLCFVCLNRIAPGVIRHTAHGLVVLGEHGRPALSRTHQLAEMFQNSGTRCRVTDDLALAHWEKLVWNIPFNGLGVAGVVGLPALLRGEAAGVPRGDVLTTDRLLGGPEWEQVVRALMREVIMAAQAVGHNISPSVIDHQVERTRIMGAYKASTLLDFEQNRSLELEHLFFEPLRRGTGAGVSMPVLSAVCPVLRQLESRRSPPSGPDSGRAPSSL